MSTDGSGKVGGGKQVQGGAPATEGESLDQSELDELKEAAEEVDPEAAKELLKKKLKVEQAEVDGSSPTGPSDGSPGGVQCGYPK